MKSKEVYSRTGKAILRLDYEPWRDGTFDRKQKQNCSVLNHRSQPRNEVPKIKPCAENAFEGNGIINIYLWDNNINLV